VVGHGIDDLLADAFDGAHSFFAQPEATKEQVPRDDSFGFVPHHDAALDPTRQTGLTEYLDLPLDADSIVVASLDTGFWTRVRRYQRAVGHVAGVLLAAIAVALDLPPAFFADRMAAPPSKLRFLHYLPVAVAQDATVPIATDAHTDYGVITLLATDGVPGLQLRPHGLDWQPVSTPPGALIVNLGDLLAVWTNLRYRSTQHRVVGSATSHRYSIPYFVNVDDDTLVEALPSCVDSATPPQLAPVTAGAYLAGRIAKTIPEPFIR